MKTIKTVLSASSIIFAVTIAALSANAQQNFPGLGHVNGTAANDGGAITNVMVSNDANNITFTIDSSQPQASYIFFTIEMQIVGQAANGSTSLVNPWGEHIGISTGVNSLINTYGTGASALTYAGGTWTQNASANYAAGGTGFNYATITTSLASLGLNPGNSFYFDVVSSYANPGGQSAYCALDGTGWPAETDNSYTPWNGGSTPNYYDSATDPGGSTFGTATTLFTVQAVPEPATLALLSGAALLLALRRRWSP